MWREPRRLTCFGWPPTDMQRLRQKLARLASQYGMLAVLLLLCVYYSIATLSEQQLSGVDAARQIAGQIPGGRSVLLVARSGEQDRSFLEELESRLRQSHVRVVDRVEGEPRDLRVVLERLAAQQQALDAIATTADCAGWTLVKSLPERFPALGTPAILVSGSIRWPTFLTRQNLLNVANQIAVVAILAVGMTVVIITGGIDLSVGSLVALSAVVVTVLIRDVAGATAASAGALVACCAGAILLCLFVGMFSGAMIAGFGVPPFIVTLAIMQVASGLAFIVARGGSIYEVPDQFTWLGRGTGPLGIPIAVLLMLALYALAHALMAHTVLGRRIYAVGGNPEAARLSGVNVGAVLLFAYALCGAMAGLAGVLQASQLKSGAPTYGLMYELYAIAAVVVGGTSLSGGEGRILGTLIGAFIIAVIQNGMNLTGVQSYQQKVVLGTVILGAVLLDLFKKKDWRGWVSRWLRSGN